MADNLRRMARKLRIQFPGAIYHAMSRGDRREDIFRDDFDREAFLQALADVCAKTGWLVHAFCLMPNHFHLVVETPQPNLVPGMKWFLGTYTARFNRRHRLNGHVFAGRYKSLLVGGSAGYLRTVCDYVHLNPVRARLISPDAALRSYRWSSLPSIFLSPEERPAWLRVDRLLGESGIQHDDATGASELEQRLEGRREDASETFDSVRRGWCFGDDQFRQEMLTRVEGEARSHHFGSEIHEASEAKASRIIDEELRRAVWSAAELKLRLKGDPGKVAIARRLRAETTVTLQWIAAQLHMGTKSHLSHLLYWQRRSESEDQSIKAAKASVKAARLRVSLPNRTERKSRTLEAVPVIATEREQALLVADLRSDTNVTEISLPMTDPDGVGGFDTSFD